MTSITRKSDICLCKNKDTDQLCSICTADQRLCFPTWNVQFLFFLNLKSQATSLCLRLYRQFCVRPVRKPPRLVFSNRGSYKPLHSWSSSLYGTPKLSDGIEKNNHHRHYILLTVDYMLYIVHYVLRKVHYMLDQVLYIMEIFIIY